jgi:hypothetical protein
MKYKHNTQFLLLTVVISFCSCGTKFSKFVCGEESSNQKTFIDSVNIKFNDKLTLSYVPCYADYMEVHLKTDYEKWIIDSLENEYERSINWAEFLVYNKDGDLIRGSHGSM